MLWKDFICTCIKDDVYLNVKKIQIFILGFRHSLNCVPDYVDKQIIDFFMTASETAGKVI